jgi:cell division protein FtsN
MRNKILFVITMFWVASTTNAQSVDSSLYLRAQEMVANGDAASGRALVDSILHVTSPDSVRYAEGLYWRATLAASATTAEQDYRRIIVDYPMSPWVDKALLRMGQLELTLSEYDEALQHLQRIPAEHPNSTLRANASYWMARVLFEKNDITHACAANAEALARVSQSDIELRNQIDFQRQRCHDVAVTAPKESTTTTVAPQHTQTQVAEKPAVKPLGKPDKTKPSTAKPKIIPKTIPETLQTQVATSAKVPAAIGAGYTVQVAAYYDRQQAYDLAAKLHTRGYKTAHVEGEKAPYRVRIGPFQSHTAATKMLAELKGKKISGFIAEK